MVLFDGDVLVYRAGFAGESKTYTVTIGDSSVTFYDKELASDYFNNNANKKPELIEEKTPEPLSYTLNTVKLMISKALRDCEEDTYKVYLTHEDSKLNFRVNVAKTLPYKGNRKDAPKPIHYDKIREYLVRYHDAEVVYGIEADDALGVEQGANNEKTIIASVDKDLLMIPGHHYDIATSRKIKSWETGFLELEETKSGGKKLIGCGFRWFCAQMLTGDRVDNIQGIPRFGAVKAYKALYHVPDSYRSLWNVVKNEYSNAGLSADRLIENANLLWILRNKDEYFLDWLEKNIED